MPRTLIHLDPFLDLITTSLTTIRTTLDGHRTAATQMSPPDPEWEDLLARAQTDTDTVLGMVAGLHASLDALQEAGDTVIPWVRSSLRRPPPLTGDTR